MTVNDYHNDEKLIYRSKESTGFSFKTKSGDDLEIVLSETPSMNRIKSNGRSQSLSEFGKSSDIKVYCRYKKWYSNRCFRPEIFVAVWKVYYQGSPISSDMELKLSGAIPMQWICSSKDNGPCNSAIFDRININLMIVILTVFTFMF